MKLEQIEKEAVLKVLEQRIKLMVNKRKYYLEKHLNTSADEKFKKAREMANDIIILRNAREKIRLGV